MSDMQLKKENTFLEKKVDKLKLEKYKLTLKHTKDKAKNHTTKFKKEMNKALLTALVAAFGFLIALSWRDVIKEFVARITSASPIQGSLIEAFFVTIIAVIGIIIITHFLSENKK